LGKALKKVTSTGRNISLGYNVTRKFKKLYLSNIQFDVSIENMKDVDMEIDGRMRNLNSGKIDIVFHSYLMTSLKARWETRGYLYFISRAIDKFVYKLDKPAYRGIVIGDTNNLINDIKGFLNVYAHVGGTKKGPKGRLKGGWV